MFTDVERWTCDECGGTIDDDCTQPPRVFIVYEMAHDNPERDWERRRVRALGTLTYRGHMDNESARDWARKAIHEQPYARRLDETGEFWWELELVDPSRPPPVEGIVDTVDAIA